MSDETRTTNNDKTSKNGKGTKIASNEGKPGRKRETEEKRERERESERRTGRQRKRGSIASVAARKRRELGKVEDQDIRDSNLSW